MNKIGLIIPWFGMLPTYFPFFIKGCEHNKDILDIHIFTDSYFDIELPTNIIVHHISFDDLITKISDKVQFQVKINNPYKLCDYKPLLGKIFEEDIIDYEFWGYGDIDVIYGDLKKFLKPDFLEKYDIITFREYIISGAFTLLRNNEYTRNLYKLSPDLDRVFKEEKYIAFDEAGKKIDECKNRIPAYDLLHVDNFVCWTTIVQKEAQLKNLRLYSEYYINEAIVYSIVLKYNNGVLKIHNVPDEYCFFHLVTDKRNPEFKIPNWNKIPNIFFITSTGFYSESEYNTLFTLLHSYRRMSGTILTLKKRVTDSFNYRFLMHEN